jgi:dienelactone hydrolase
VTTPIALPAVPLPPPSDVPAGSAIVEERFVPTWDGLYAPIALRLPDAREPAPVVLLASGNGGGGLPEVREAVRNQGLVMDRLVAAGYACAWIRYRTEVELGYNLGGSLVRDVRAGGELFNRAPLEFEDELAIIEHLAADPAIDAARIALVGVSHAGEMILKLLAAPDHGVAVAVASEPASHEFLALRRQPDEDVEHLRTPDVASVRARIDLEVAQPRVERIRTPVLVMGRDADPLQPVFRATYDLLSDAGADVRWTSYDHPEHGYVLPTRAADGTYADLAGSQRAIAEVIAYLDEVLGIAR